MRYGDKDGFNEIYDQDGDLKMNPNEKKLVVEENVVPTLKSTWRYYGGEYLLEPSKGTIYLTNERLVFINIPERMFAIGGEDEARAMSTGEGKSFELGEKTPSGALREYFEIPCIEVMASEKKEGAVSVGEMVNVFILSSGNQFHLSMVLDSDSDLLKRLMNKKVKNLDELVNNLKDFFRNTNWMFNDAEKKLYKDLGSKVEAEMQPEAVHRPEVKKEKIDPGPAKPKKPAIPEKPLPKVSGRLGKQSLEYFEKLYRKGLIKDEIYRRLVSEYGGGNSNVNQTAQAPQETPEENIPEASEDVQEAVPEPEVEEQAAPDEVKDPQDDELLNMLDETLSDFSDDEGAKKDPGPKAEKPEKKKVVRRVRRKV